MRVALALCVLAAPAGAYADPVAEIAAPGADVVVLGEVHDNPDHHLTQAAALAAIGPTAVVWEMLSPEQAIIVNGADGADPGAIGWAESGWPDFAIYAPVFEAAAGVPAHGGSAPVSEVRRAIGAGAASVMAELLPEAPDFGLSDPLPEAEQDARETGQLAAHCDALPPEMLPGFVEAQRLRDAVLAARVVAALEAHGPPVAVITGNGHARPDWGVPALLLRARPDLEVVSMGQFEDALPEMAEMFDVATVAPAAEREDPCAVFRQ